MIRLTIASLARAAFQAYRDVLFGNVAVTRRMLLNFAGGGVSSIDNYPLASTDIAIPGYSLTIVDHTASATLQPGQLGRFVNTSGIPLVATFADGTAAGQRIAAMLVSGGNASVGVAMGNVDTTCVTGMNVGRCFIFVWNRIGSGAFKWWVDSTDKYPPA